MHQIPLDIFLHASIPQYKLFSSNPSLNFYICKGLGLENLEALVKKTVLSKDTLIISCLMRDSTANFNVNMLYYQNVIYEISATHVCNNYSFTVNDDIHEAEASGFL